MLVVAGLVPCEQCDGYGWYPRCDCDPDGDHECHGQGSCGQGECDACEGTGEVESKGSMRVDAEEIARALFKADEADVKAVWGHLGASSHMKHADLRDSLWTLWLMRWKSKAMTVLRSIRACLVPYTHEGYRQKFETAWMAKGVGNTLRDIETSGLLDEQPVLDVKPAPELAKMGQAELIKLVQKLQALVAMKDEALKKQNTVLYDPHVRHTAAERALNATPEDAKGLYENLMARIEDLNSESWAYQTAFKRLEQRHSLMADALHDRIAALYDTIVDLWHAGKVEGELHEALGMTKEQYALWVTDPKLKG